VAGAAKIFPFRVEPLGSRHDRENFSCGAEALDRYLQRQASQDVRRRVAVVFVATADGRTIAGYYTLSQYSVELDQLPPETAKRLPKYPRVPATLLGRLAISTAFQGRGLGRFLLMDALCRSLEASRTIASAAVFIHAKDEAAAAFYRKYGFLGLPKVPRQLFLPMGTIEQLFA